MRKRRENQGWKTMLRISELYSKELKITKFKRPKRIWRHVCLLKLLCSWKHILKDVSGPQKHKSLTHSTVSAKSQGFDQPGARVGGSRKHSTSGHPATHRPATGRWVNFICEKNHVIQCPWRTWHSFSDVRIVSQASNLAPYSLTSRLDSTLLGIKSWTVFY